MTSPQDQSGETARTEIGLEDRFRVERLTPSTRGIDHTGCRYFVLDPQHDKAARFALRAYMVAAENAGQWALARDLREWLVAIMEADDA